MKQKSFIQVPVRLPSGVVYVTEVGSGRPIVALHGCPGSASDFAHLARCVGESWRLVAPDLPGFGASVDAGCAPVGARAQAEVVCELLNALDLQDVVLLAHSYASHTALRVAAACPGRLSGVALVAPLAMRPHEVMRKTPFGLLDWLLRSPLRPLLMPLLRQGFVRSGFELGAGDGPLLRTVELMSQVDFDQVRGVLAQLRVPTLVAWAADDPVIQAALAEELAAALPDGPRVFFDHGGHSLMVSQAQALADALTQWIKPSEPEVQRTATGFA